MHKPAHIAENELIAQCKTGSLKYQEVLYKQYYGFAMGIGMRYSLNRDDALEAVNDAFIKIFKNIHSYEPDKPFKLKHQLNIELDNAVQVPQNTASAVESLHVQDILKLLAQLPALHAAIFNLYEIDGYSHDEIAKMLSIPASSSRVYLTRAKEKLKKLLLIITYNERRSV